ncbi:MAG TPA: HAD hydrolase family protein, partial [Candidatus Thermoplasmatota archaeon]|nr:HAD hydrolase family protein [Candidatus Thermoplasmatota archaeon]
TDFDRTFTDEQLRLCPDAIARCRELRRRGLRVLLVTGRAEEELPEGGAIDGCFDAMVLEGGALWGLPGSLQRAPANDRLWALAARLAAGGLDVRRGTCSFSVEAAAEPLLPVDDPHLTWKRNADRIDVTPPGVDKAFGLRQVLGTLGLQQPPWVVAIGDSTNDVPFFAAADLAVAVANAVPQLLEHADLQAPYPACQGFLWTTASLLEHVA